MKSTEKYITNLINNLSQENTLKVIKIPLGESIGSPKIYIGTQPYYDWSKNKEVTFIITRRVLTCEMLVYEKLLRDIDEDSFITNNINKAIKHIIVLLPTKTQKK